LFPPAGQHGPVAALIQTTDEATPKGLKSKFSRVINGDATVWSNASITFCLRRPGPQGHTTDQSRDESALVPARFLGRPANEQHYCHRAAGRFANCGSMLLRLDQKDIEQAEEHGLSIERKKTPRRTAVAKSINDSDAVKELFSRRPLVRSVHSSRLRAKWSSSRTGGQFLIISATPRFLRTRKAGGKVGRSAAAGHDSSLDRAGVAEHTNEFGVELGLQDSLLFDRSLLEAW